MFFFPSLLVPSLASSFKIEVYQLSTLGERFGVTWSSSIRVGERLAASGLQVDRHGYRAHPWYIAQLDDRLEVSC